VLRVVLVFPTSKCKLRLLKLERIKDFLLMEEEFIRNQEVFKPREEQNEVINLNICSLRFIILIFEIRVNELKLTTCEEHHLRLVR
jgi:hypothetical protein